MDAWSKPFQAYHARTAAYPWWVTRIPLGISLLLLLPLAVLALIAVVVGLVLFALLLAFWRIISGLFPAAPSGPAEPPEEGRINVRVMTREE